MTQFSYPWGCTNTGDGGSDSFSLDVVRQTNMYLNNKTPVSGGVVWWRSSIVPPFSGFANAVDNLLEPSNPSGNTVRIASGVGLVMGTLFLSDENVDFDVSGGNANATDIIVLRRTAASQTVRLALVRGAASSTATVTQTASIWEVKLCEVALNGSGNFSSLTDTRRLAISHTGSSILIDRLQLSSATSRPTISDIPSVFFKNLKVVAELKSEYTPLPTLGAYLYLNNDTGANYTHTYTRNNSGTVSGVNGTVPLIGVVVTSDAAVNAAQRSTLEMIIPNPNEAYWKNCVGQLVSLGNTINFGVEWQSTASITSIGFECTAGANDDFDVGTDIRVYGIV